MSSSDDLAYVEKNPPGDQPSGTLICLHGLGANGHDLAEMAKQIPFPPSLRFVFPHAPVRPVTLNAQLARPAWYDIYGLSIDSQEDKQGIELSAQKIFHLIDKEIQRGIPSEKIFLLGFSQGGALALYSALRFPQRLGGVLALSAYLPLAGYLKDEAHIVNQALPIFIGHGDKDDIVSLALCEMSIKHLESLNYLINFTLYSMGHQICAQEIYDVISWVSQRI